MKQGRWAIAAVSVVLGVMIVVQFRMTQETAGNNIRLQRTEDLASKLADTEKQNDQLKKELETLQLGHETGTAHNDVETLRYAAGLTAVKGKGVTVTIEDSRTPVKTGENANLYLIHDEDMLKVINELRAAGAEAISINDQRLVGTTEIRCVGPTVVVNRKSFAPPFVIRAIGDPNSLNGALTMRGGIGETLKYWGIIMTIKKEDTLVVPAYNGTFTEEFGKAFNEGGDKA